MESTIQTQQKLAAIMFTDIISFSKMTGNNEKKALSILKEHNRLLSDQFTQHNGCIIKELGDGYLTEFSSSLESVNAAIAIQHSLYVYNATQEIDNRINIRIGIHLGDIVKTDNEDILGDGVNIASRIEPFSEPNGGGLCFSQQIYDQVHNKINFDIESIGKKKLKNITKPHELYRVILPFQKSDIRSVGKRKVKNSIAVLPFENMSSDKDNEYFADGITESLLDVMAKEKELKVISRTSAFTYKGKDIPAKQIGRELNVEHILEGSVRKSGDKVRITAQLIQVADDFHLWSETYDRTLDDIFAIQDEIASKILTQLLERLFTCENCSSTNNQEVYELYHKGRHHWNQRSKEEIEKAIECFEKSLEIDPEFSKAYSGLIDSWTMQASRQYEKKEDILPKCKEVVAKAKALGDISAEFYTSQSEIYYVEGDVDKSLEYLKVAIDENPNYATAHHWLAIRYDESGENKKAVEEIEKAVALDPKSPIILFAASCQYANLGNREIQKEYLKKTMELSPGFQSVEVSFGNMLRDEYKWEEAEEYLLELRKLDYYKGKNRNKLSLLSSLFYLFINTNQIKKANNIQSEMIKIVENVQNIMEKLSYYFTIADSFYIQENFTMSTQYISKAIELHTNEEELYSFLSISLTCEGKYDEAIEALEKITHSNCRGNDILWIEYAKTLSYIKKEDLEKTYLNINKIKNMDGDKDCCHSHDKELVLYLLYFTISDYDKGFKWYEKRVNKLKRPCFTIIYDPWCQNARKDERYIELLKEMKLYDYWKDSL